VKIIIMAEDTRDPDNVSHDKQIEDATKLHHSPPPAKNPKHEFPKSQVGKLWDVFGNPEEPINLFSERTHNTAGGKSKDITLTDVIKSMSLQDFSSFHKAPCARDSLLLGLGAGFGVGGVRGILGGIYLEIHDRANCWLIIISQVLARYGRPAIGLWARLRLLPL
jgi:cytochrome c oxidase assembly protein subunit 20